MRFSSVVLENDEHPSLTIEEVEATFGVSFTTRAKSDSWTARTEKIVFWVYQTEGTTRLEISSVGGKFRLGDVLTAVMKLAMSDFTLTPATTS